MFRFRRGSRNRALAAHLRDGDIAVPVRDLRAVAGEGDAVDAVQPVGRRNDDRLAEAVDVEARVVLALAPGVEDAAFVAASTAGDSAMIAPGLRSRLGQPSSRLPMPGANELSTVEWHSAQVMPTRVSGSTPLTVSTVPLRPTTASSFSRATVVAGLRRDRCCRSGCPPPPPPAAPRRRPSGRPTARSPDRPPR